MGEIDLPVSRVGVSLRRQGFSLCVGLGVWCPQVCSAAGAASQFSGRCLCGKRHLGGVWPASCLSWTKAFRVGSPSPCVCARGESCSQHSHSQHTHTIDQGRRRKRVLSLSSPDLKTWQVSWPAHYAGPLEMAKFPGFLS